MASTRRPFLAALAVVAGAGMTGPLSAQSWEINDEIEFAKNMARFRLFDLSSEHLDNLAREDLEGDDNLAILYARAMLFRIAGEYAIGYDNQMDYLGKATQGYEEFLQRASDSHDQYSLAQGEAAEVQRSLGSLLARRIEIGDAPEGAKELAETAFRKAIERLNKELARKKREYENLDRSDWTEEQTNNALVEAYRPMYHLTATYYEFSQLYEPGEFNREDYLTKASDTADEFLWDVPSGAFIAYQVYYYAGLAQIGLGEPEEGFDRLQFIVDRDSGLPSWVADDEDIPPAWAAQITREVEKAYLAIARQHNEAGQYAEAEKQVGKLERYFKDFGDRGCERGPLGEECQIELGRALHMQAKPEGMALLQQIANAHASDEIGAKAASAIGSILEGSGLSATAVIPATVWMTAAQAAQAEGKFFEGLENYHKALAALSTITDEAERVRIAVDCWNNIGRLYRGENRLVEAAAAFDAGLAVPDRTDEDAKALGSALFNTLQRRYRETKHREDERRKDQAMTRLKDLGLEEMGFLLARDDFEAARVIPEDQAAQRQTAFKEAVKELKNVNKNDPNYERALILIARADGEAGDFDAAIKKIDAYFKRVEDARNAIGGTERVKARNREISTCEATFYRAEYLAQLAKHAEVLTTLVGFEDKFPSQDKFFSQVNYLRLRAHLGQTPAQIAEAEKLFEEQYAAGRLPMEAQYFLARALLEKAQEAEDAGDTDRARGLRVRGAGHMDQYCKNSGYSSYANMKVAGDNFRAVGEHARAEAVYLKITEQFGGRAAYEERIEKVVKRNLAEVLLAQDKFQPAADLYSELLETFDNKDLGIMKQAARALGGRLDVKGSLVTEVPGSGDYKAAVDLWDTITDQGFDRNEKYSIEWWEAKCYAIYTRYRARDVSPEWETQAKKVVTNLLNTTLVLYKKPGSDLVDWDAVFKDQPPEVVADWKARFEYLFVRLR